MEVGKSYYFITHTYFHYIGEVKEILGKHHIIATKLVAIHSCARSWTQFFAEGFKKDSQYDFLPDGEIQVLNCFDWEHKIPKASLENYNDPSR